MSSVEPGTLIKMKNSLNVMKEEKTELGVDLRMLQRHWSNSSLTFKSWKSFNRAFIACIIDTGFPTHNKALPYCKRLCMGVISSHPNTYSKIKMFSLNKQRLTSPRNRLIITRGKITLNWTSSGQHQHVGYIIWVLRRLHGPTAQLNILIAKFENL